MPTAEQAQEFLKKYVSDTYQLHHSEMVAAAMEAVAKELKQPDTERFYITGLIHDWDFGKWPEEHPGRYELLQSEIRVDQDIIEAIKGHVGVNASRPTILAKALFACDEFSGLLYAYMKMVGNYGSMKISSISKKVHKEINFAAKINRNDVITGITELGIPEDRFYELVRDTFASKYD